MKRDLRVLAAAGSLLLTLSIGPSAFAQKQGGILKLGHFDSPASMSMLEESTQAVNRPMCRNRRKSLFTVCGLLVAMVMSRCWSKSSRILGFKASSISPPPELRKPKDNLARRSVLRP